MAPHLLAQHIAILAMDGGGALGELAGPQLSEALSLIEPPVSVRGGRVAAARSLVRVGGEIPILDSDPQRPRAATMEEARALEDGLVGSVWERQAIDTSSRMDRDAVDRLQLSRTEATLEELGLSRGHGWSVLGEALLGNGLFGVSVTEIGCPLVEAERVKVPPLHHWSTQMAWPTLLAALPARLCRVARPQQRWATELHELLRQTLVAVLGNRDLSPEHRHQSLELTLSPKDLRVLAPGSPLRWLGWGDGPTESAHRNPLFAQWLSRCCEDYRGLLGLEELAHRQGLTLSWVQQDEGFGITLSRDRVQERAANRRRGQREDEEAVLLALRELGGEGVSRELAERTQIPRSTLALVLARLEVQGKVDVLGGAKRSKNTRYVLVPEAT